MNYSYGCTFLDLETQGQQAVCYEISLFVTKPINHSILIGGEKRLKVGKKRNIKITFEGRNKKFIGVLFENFKRVPYLKINLFHPTHANAERSESLHTGDLRDLAIRLMARMGKEMRINMFQRMLGHPSLDTTKIKPKLGKQKFYCSQSLFERNNKKTR
jgi:hypothetical protein